MYLKQIYTGCLSEAAYFVESNGEAILIDPLRNTEEYLKLPNSITQKLNTFLKLIFMQIL